MTEKRIEARVAAILNAKELVLNRGDESGVEVGMRFAILEEGGLGIVDPETGDSLGDVERPKTIVKVTQVRKKMSVASTYRTKRVGGGPLFPYLSREFLEKAPRTVVETLHADEYEPAPSEEESIVHKNDRAVQVIGDEYSGWGW